jgi:DNA-binding response OmpR family regulator
VNMKTLVVDDDPAILALMTEAFTALRADMHSIRDSRQAATVVNQEKFDGVFLEVDMNGLELARTVRSSSANKHTPIVMITRLEKSDAMYEAFAAGGTFFLQKPLDRTTLVNLLETMQQPLFEERRRYTRVPLHTEITCCVGSKTVTGTAWNLSQGGMQIEVPGLQCGEKVQVSFRPPNPRVLIEASGSVAWVKDDRQGIHFTAMSVEHQQIVRNFIGQLTLSPR